MVSAQTVLRRYRTAVEQSDRLGAGEILAPVLTTYRQRAEFRLRRLQEMLAVLGDPLSATPIVHVAGTSGKGSTATAIAAMLTAAGYRTGLHTSPYLQVATEKLQIDHELIAGDVFADLVDDTLGRLERAGFRPSYGQLWMAMVLRWFEQEMVDVAVIEVGAGGRFDLSNVVHPMVSVITEIGFDHMDTLGSTIEEIAWHKAGIIEPATPVVAAISDRAALQIVADEAQHLAADLSRVIPTPGDFRRSNEETARLAVEWLGFDIDSDDLADGLAHDRLPGRGEIVQYDPLVLLDGAHNPQKIDALLRWFAHSWPDTRPVIVAGFLDAKDIRGMLELLVRLASTLVLTAPQIEGKPGADIEQLAMIARESGFSGAIHTEILPETAVGLGIELATHAGRPLIVTGSLYLIGNVRGRWYADDAVLLQRTPWPHGTGSESRVQSPE